MMGTMSEVLSWESAWLPRYPYVTDSFTEGLWREKRDKALSRRYVELNPKALTNMLCVDIDGPDALLRAGWCTSYRPNWVVENPVNGHAHAIWLLASPIPRTQYAHRKPVAYAHAITEGLRIAVDGDKGYSGLITKNPLHASWEAYQFHTRPYGLDELKSALETDECMPEPSWRKTKRRNVTGLGRNCSIFDSARLWAYREVRNHFGKPESLERAVMAHVAELNDEFPEPLPAKEAEQIAQSIDGWIVRESSLWADGPAVYEANFVAIQSARGRKGGRKGGLKSGQARTSKAQERKWL